MFVQRAARSLTPVMGSRFRSYLYQGAASALFACATPAFSDPVEESANLPRWMVRAQQRLALQPVQQRELRELVQLNTSKMAALQRRLELQSGDERAHARHDEMAVLQREFREGLAAILSPDQLAEWDTLLEELLGEVHLRNAPLLAERQH